MTEWNLYQNCLSVVLTSLEYVRNILCSNRLRVQFFLFRLLLAVSVQSLLLTEGNMTNIDDAFSGAGKVAGIELWRIEKMAPARVSEVKGKFYQGDSYILLCTTATKR